MKKVFLILAFCSIITFFFVWYSKWMDCSVYDDLINTIEAQINNLKMRAARENMAFSNSSSYDQFDQALLYSSKYWDQLRSLQKEYDSAVQQKNNCLANGSPSYNTNDNYTLTTNNFNDDVNIFNLFADTLTAWFDAKNAKNYDAAIQYFVQWINICENFPNSTNIQKFCGDLPHNTASLCFIAWNEARKIWNYEKAVEYFNKWLEYDPNDDWIYLWLWNIAYQQKDYKNAISYFELAKKYAKNNEDKERYEWYIKDSKEKLWNIVDSGKILTVTTVLSPWFANKFSIYKNIAYDFAFNNQITTMPTVEQADMYWSLDRIAMAKMISNYAINVLWLIPNSNGNCTFKDVPSDINEAYDYWVTKSCQLWLMWQWIKDFRPYDKVTRAEFATVLSRLVNRDSDDLARLNSADPYYTEHMKYLENNWIIDDVVKLSISNNEIRWYVMLMLMRAQVADNDTAQEYYDSLWDKILSCAEEIWDISENFDFDNFNKIKETCNESLNNIVNIGSWNWDATLFNAIIEYNLYLSKFLDALYKYTENPTDKLEKEFDDVVYYMENTLDSKFDDAEQAFADKYGVDIE